MLEAAPQIDIVGEASTGREALSLAKELKPDVILMDIMMPDLNGVSVTKQVLGNHPAIGIIMLTMLEDDESVFAAMCAGARGYLLKGSDKKEVLDAIQAVAGGAAVFGPAVAVRISQLFQGVRKSKKEVFPDLTEREREVLEKIAAGSSNAEIAINLHISKKTVSNHISNIFNKLKVSDRAQAIVKARDSGFRQYG